MCANDVGRLSGREYMSKTKVALNPRLRLQIFHVTVKRPSKVGQRKVRSLVRNRNKEKQIKNIQIQLFEYSIVGLYCGSAQVVPLNRA